MGSFSLFYQNGGFFMHLVSLAGVAGAVYGVQALRLSKGAKEGESKLNFERVLGWVVGLTGLAMAFGVLGTCMGLHEAAYAARSVPFEEHNSAFTMGAGIALNTTTYGLMVAIPLVFIYLLSRSRNTKALALG